MQSLDGSRGRVDRSSHTDDLDALIQLAELHTDAASFGDWLAVQLEARPATAGPVVHLSTVHRVKGLEWPHVVVHEASARLFPHRLADDVEEERRVFHVAVTRGSATVTVVAPERAPSPFVAQLVTEAPPAPVERPGPAPTPTRAPPVAAAPKRPAAPGDEGLRAALQAWRLDRSRADASRLRRLQQQDPRRPRRPPARGLRPAAGLRRHRPGQGRELRRRPPRPHRREVRLRGSGRGGSG